MNKLLKVTLITAIMATSGMSMCGCGGYQYMKFNSEECSQSYTISSCNTWITDTESDWTDITGDVKITGLSRWINKGGIGLNGEENIIDHSEVINKGRIDVLGEEGNLDVTGNSSIYLRHGAGIGAYDGGILDVKDNSSIYLRGGAYIEADEGGILNVTGNSSISLRDGSYIDAYGEGGILNIEDNSSISLRDGSYINAYGEGGILDVTDNSSISLRDGSYINAYYGGINVTDNSSIYLRDGAGIGAYVGGILNIEDKSTVNLMDSAYIGAIHNGTININEGCIFDARDSKDLRKWNTFGGTFKMLPGSIMYLPSTDIGDKKADSGLRPFTITLPSEGDKPVELRYIQHTDITFDGLCPNVTHSGCKYKLSDWKKDTDNDDISYIQEPNTGIKFTWEGINENTNAIPPSIAKLVPIYTWSVSTKCNGEDVKILESRDLQCCDDILW